MPFGQEDDDDDVYGGFGDDVDDGDEAKFGGVGGGVGGGFANAPPPTSLGRGPPGTQMGSRLMTGQQQQQGVDERPMTAVVGAGYSSGAGGASGGGSRGGFDPLNQGNRGPAPALAEKTDDSPEERAKEMEKGVNALLEQSAEATARKQKMLALEKAKEAAKKERQLCKHRDQNGLSDQQNMELAYAISFNLANTYALNAMLAEALSTYSLIVKNKQFPHAGRLRVNMGNIHYAQGDYLKAIRMYRMALDQIPNTGKDMRFKIMRNVGNAFIRVGQFPEAIENFEAIMSGTPEWQSGFNLVVCHYALGDKDQMRKSFSRLLDVTTVGASGAEDDDDDDDDDDDHLGHGGGGGGGLGDENDEGKMNEAGPGGSGLGGISGGEDPARARGGADESAGGGEEKGDDAAALGATQGPAKAGQYVDELKVELRRREKRARSLILDAARLIAPCIDSASWVGGYDWVIDNLRRSPHAHVASEVEIAKAVEYLKRKQFDKAIEVLKAFEKKDHHLKAKAATNLSFLYFLEAEYALSDKFANMAVRHDRYNAKALVNKGNCLFVKGELERARELFLEAIGVEADCSEAIYNLGLVNQRMGHLEEALQAFEKLHSIVPNSPEVIYQIANLHDLLLDFPASQKWFNILISRVPTDPHVLARMGQIFNKDEDETQALHFQLESYRYLPVNLDVISWLGVWYVKTELYEKAIEFFQRAAQIQPQEVKWRLMVTSCYRRMGALQRALDEYEKIHREYPDNVECLRYLVALSKDMGLPYDEYQAQLARLERSVPAPTGAVPAGSRALQGGLTQAVGVKAKPKPGAAPRVVQPQQHVQRKADHERERERDFADDEEAKIPGAKEERKIAAAANRGPGPASKAVHAEDEDDWGDADLDDLLAE